MPTWRKIKTAPKDGTPIVGLWFPYDEPFPVCDIFAYLWWEPSEESPPIDAGWYRLNEIMRMDHEEKKNGVGSDNLSVIDDPEDPLFWMPCPRLPKYPGPVHTVPELIYVNIKSTDEEIIKLQTPDESL